MTVSGMLVPASTHQRLIIKCYLATRIFYALLFTLLSALPLFDTSPLVVIPARSLSWSSTLLRWDAFHFASIAQVGYIYEYQFAFQPGMPLVMRWLGSGINFLGGDGKPMSISQMLVGGTVGSFFAGFSALDLYRYLDEPLIA